MGFSPNVRARTLTLVIALLAFATTGESTCGRQSELLPTDEEVEIEVAVSNSHQKTAVQCEGYAAHISTASPVKFRGQHICKQELSSPLNSGLDQGTVMVLFASLTVLKVFHTRPQCRGLETRERRRRGCRAAQCKRHNDKGNANVIP